MPIAIDGSNLGGSLGGRAGARDARAVVELLQPWARRRGGRVVLVFDGPPRPDVAERYGALEVRWSGAESADQVLARLVSEGPKDWWVVTNDRALAERCAALGARRIALGELVGRIPATGVRRAGMRRAGEAGDPVDVDFWERWFRGEVE